MCPENVEERKNRVLIVDDSKPICEAISVIIATLPDFEFCATATNETDAIRIVRELQPDIAIIDISLNDSCGLDLVRKIRSIDEDLKILVWSLHSEKDYQIIAIRAGATGYITKDRAIHGITEALRQIAAGKRYFMPPLSENKFGHDADIR